MKRQNVQSESKEPHEKEVARGEIEDIFQS
jgi:hypothetical protein